MMRRTAILMAALAFAGQLALAQTADTKRKVDIEADQMQIDEQAKQAVFRGQVRATREDMTLNSDELVVHYAEVKQADGSTKTDATRLDAKGSVVITTKKERITGEWARFDPQANTMVVGGNVRLEQGATVLTGPELRADMTNNKIEMSGGRVKGSFLPQ